MDEEKSKESKFSCKSRLKMNSSLKKRLKQSSRMQLNPLLSTTPKATDKRSCFNDISENHKSITPIDIEFGETCISYSKEKIETCDNKETLWEMFTSLKRSNAEADEKLRKLLLVRHHQIKNAPDGLIKLIQKWLTAGQLSLRKLYEILPDPKPDDLGRFMINLQISTDMLKYNSENDTFNSS